MKARFAASLPRRLGITAYAVSNYTIATKPASIVRSVCRGEESGGCRPTDAFVGCGAFEEGVADIKDKCSSLTSVQIYGRGGGACGFNVRVSFVPVAHEGCTQSSRAEAEAIAELVRNACTHSLVRDGKAMPITLKDILVVAPYNLQVNMLKQLLPEGAQIGTVDKFQGQEAAIVIVSMATSRGTEAPRGTEFLYVPKSDPFDITRP